MPGSISNHAETRLLKFLLTELPVTRPSARYAALHSAAPGENCANAELGILGRKAVSFGAPSGGQVKNTGSITFSLEPGESATMTHWSAWDNSSGGNPLGWGTLKSSARLGQPFFQGNGTGQLSKTYEAGALVCVARGVTNFSKNLALDWLFRSVAVTRPTQWWMSVHRMPPNDLGVGGEFNILGAARQPLAFMSPVNGVAVCGDEVVFGPANSTWPRLTHYAIWDDPTAGNCLFVKELKGAYDVLTGGRLRFASGSINVTVN